MRIHDTRQRRIHRLGVLLACIGLSAASASALALPEGEAETMSVESEQARSAQDLRPFQGRCMSLNEAVERAKRQGRVISAETRGSQHVVKVLTSDNRVKTLTFPACS